VRPALAALAVLATACCLDLGPADACVEVSGGRATCRPVDSYVCWSCVADEDAEYTSSSEDCVGGELHGDTKCADLGYTAPCQGGAWFVRPGAGC
jgi:hypothetical protein